MKPLTTSLLALTLGLGAAAVGVYFLNPSFTTLADDGKKKKLIMEIDEEAPEQPKGEVKKSDEEWQKELTPEQYRILRKAGTERAGGQVYKEFKGQGEGTYYCAGCNAELFSSKEKFDARCGWPSFYDPSKAKNIKYNVDFHLGYARTEVRCKVCDGHLGHVFKGEGYNTPTDKRYCINGTVLKFVPKKAASKTSGSATASEKKERSKTDSRKGSKGDDSAKK